MLTVFAVILVIKEYLCQQISAEKVLQREHLGNLKFGKALNILFNSFCSNFSNQVARLFCCPFYRSMRRGFCILVRRRCVSARLLNAKPFSFFLESTSEFKLHRGQFNNVALFPPMDQKLVSATYIDRPSRFRIEFAGKGALFSTRRP